MYRVWTKDEYSDNYTCVEIEKEEAVESAIMAGMKEGKSLLLTRDVSFALNILLNVVKEPPEKEPEKEPEQPGKPAKKEEKVEVKSSETKPVKDTGD